jgi:DNA polymerase-2
MIVEGFVLTRAWRDTPEGLMLTFWLATDEGPLRATVMGERAVAFVERDVAAQPSERRAVELRTLYGAPVDALYFDQQRQLVEERERLHRDGHATFEADVKPSERYLMERFVTGGCVVKGKARRREGFVEMRQPALKRSDYLPRLRAACFDIETDGIGGPVVSIAWLDDRLEEVLMVGEEPAGEGLRLFHDERALLEAFFARVRASDPDALVGWNVVEFDLSYLDERAAALGLRMAIGRGGERARVLPAQSAGQLPIPRVPGRIVLDGIALLRAASWSFDSFALEDVAQQLLGRGKRIDHRGDAVAEIQRLWREEPSALAAYNLEDCRLVRDIFARTELMRFAIARQRLTGLAMDRAGGSVAAFDHLYLPRLHRRGRVAGEPGMRGESLASPGGYVLPSRPGLHESVVVLDFKSLYPSIMRTFRIDPLGMAAPGDDAIEGFDGARFAREGHILPDILGSLWSERDEAKRAEDRPLSQAIKILMNSFYGVLGTPACRFFSPKLASSITRRGHDIIKRSRDWLVKRGLTVLYGDTDSLFVLLGAGTEDRAAALGEELAAELTAFWKERIGEEHRLESFLEMELDACYRRLLLPTLRGSSEGSAKRYAGWSSSQGLVIKGLEAVRSDWTPLARRFQEELLRRVLQSEPYALWMREVKKSLLGGERDEELVYEKRLRRDADAYTAALPPHVRAARLLDRPVKSVRYLITTRGPQPLEKLSAPIDYPHYVERQLAPAADAVLGCLGSSFDEVAGSQLSLF